MNWTLACNGVEKLVGDWGFTRLTRKLVSQGTDELTFIAEGTAADAAAVFTPFQDTVTLWRDRTKDDAGNWTGGELWFTGLVIQVPRRGDPAGESNSYKIAGPWWYLDTRVFEKTFNLFDHNASPGHPVYKQISFSHAFLNIGPTQVLSPFNMITTGAQIVEALNWALKPFTDASAAPPFQIGDVTPALFIAFEEVRDITCAEVIHKMLRWSPDAVTWFDYSTSPPTFHCKHRADLTIVNLPLNP